MADRMTIRRKLLLLFASAVVALILTSLWIRAPVSSPALYLRSSTPDTEVSTPILDRNARVHDEYWWPTVNGTYSLHDNPHKPGHRPPTQSEIKMTLLGRAGASPTVPSSMRRTSCRIRQRNALHSISTKNTKER